MHNVFFFKINSTKKQTDSAGTVRVTGACAARSWSRDLLQKSRRCFASLSIPFLGKFMIFVAAFGGYYSGYYR